MPVVRYTAKRSLTGGVNVNDTVTYDLPLRYAGLNRARDPLGFERRALSGRREGYYYNADQVWQCSSKPLADADLAELVMFLDSVEDGQEFLFSPFQSAGMSPMSWRNVYIKRGGYDEPRQSGRQDLRSIAFTIIERP